MNIAKQLEQFNINNVYFTDAIKNTVMDNGEFIRVIYSTPNMALNGISLLVKISNLQIEKYYNKLKCIFNITSNRETIDKIKNFENEVLEKYNCNHKIICRNIGQQLEKGFLKLYSNSNIIVNEKKSSADYLLKISGIWENDNEYGITYKFIEVNHQ